MVASPQLWHRDYSDRETKGENSLDTGTYCCCRERAGEGDPLG